MVDIPKWVDTGRSIIIITVRPEIQYHY